MEPSKSRSRTIVHHVTFPVNDLKRDTATLTAVRDAIAAVNGVVQCDVLHSDRRKSVLSLVTRLESYAAVDRVRADAATRSAATRLGKTKILSSGFTNVRS